ITFLSIWYSKKCQKKKLKHLPEQRKLFLIQSSVIDFFQAQAEIKTTCGAAINTIDTKYKADIDMNLQRIVYCMSTGISEDIDTKWHRTSTRNGSGHRHEMAPESQPCVYVDIATKWQHRHEMLADIDTKWKRTSTRNGTGHRHEMAADIDMKLHRAVNLYGTTSTRNGNGCGHVHEMAATSIRNGSGHRHEMATSKRNGSGHRLEMAATSTRNCSEHGHEMTDGSQPCIVRMVVKPCMVTSTRDGSGLTLPHFWTLTRNGSGSSILHDIVTNDSGHRHEMAADIETKWQQYETSTRNDSVCDKDIKLQYRHEMAAGSQHCMYEINGPTILVTDTKWQRPSTRNGSGKLTCMIIMSSHNSIHRPKWQRTSKKRRGYVTHAMTSNRNGSGLVIFCMTSTRNESGRLRLPHLTTSTRNRQRISTTKERRGGSQPLHVLRHRYELERGLSTLHGTSTRNDSAGFPHFCDIDYQNDGLAIDPKFVA
ncbi:hypothetical protein L9F63_000927, partial [Diploptera punctata]